MAVIGRMCMQPLPEEDVLNCARASLRITPAELLLACIDLIRL